MKPNFVFILLVILHFTSSVNAYSTCDGIQDGDVVTVSYEGHFLNGSLFDKGTNTQFFISPNHLIFGFYSNLLGMKNLEQKEFIVPPEQAYTNPDHPFFGLFLRFNVQISSIISDVDECNNNDSPLSKPWLYSLLNIFAFFIVSILIVVPLYRVLRKSKASSCNRCINTDSVPIKPSSHRCASCGTNCCSKCLKYNCVTCGSNSFFPLR